jgi:hypothetical protein
MPQNIPQVVPAPTAWWLVVTRSLPSRLRTIAATASGWITRSRSSRPTSSIAASAVVSSGYPIAIRSAIPNTSIYPPKLPSASDSPIESWCPGRWHPPMG